MPEVMCAECGNTWNPSAVNYRKFHGKCPNCGSRARSTVNIGVESIRNTEGIPLTGAIILSADDTITITQVGQDFQFAVNGLAGEKTVSVPAEALGRPNTNPPTIVDQDNITLYAFTVNTDKVTFKFPIPSDYVSGDLKFYIIWTNDGGVDDNGKNVKWQLDYQIGDEGDPVSGSHANSPKTVEDTYTSDVGFIEHHSGIMTIAAADFVDKLCIYIKLSAVTAPATVLTCEPHLIGFCFTYLVQVNHF